MANLVCRICLKNTNEGLSFCDKYKQRTISLIYEEFTGIKVCFVFILEILI